MCFSSCLQFFTIADMAIAGCLIKGNVTKISEWILGSKNCYCHIWKIPYIASFKVCVRENWDQKQWNFFFFRWHLYVHITKYMYFMLM